MFRFVPRLFRECSPFVPLFFRDVPRLFGVCFAGKFFRRDKQDLRDEDSFYSRDSRAMSFLPVFIRADPRDPWAFLKNRGGRRGSQRKNQIEKERGAKIAP